MVDKIKIVLLSILLLGCNTVEQPKPKNQWWHQSCDKCGRDWYIYLPNGGKIPPKTIEWCFSDGDYCETGFKMVIQSVKNKEDFPTDEFVKHCKKCEGCKCAFFTPKSWNSVK